METIKSFLLRYNCLDLGEDNLTIDHEIYFDQEGNILDNNDYDLLFKSKPIAMCFGNVLFEIKDIRPNKKFFDGY